MMAAINILSMEEEELLDLYLTRHGAMESVAPMRRHDNLQKQISAYEKLLQGARERFSQEQLHQMLVMASRGIPSLSRGPRTSMSSQRESSKIFSMTQLKQIVDNVSTGRRRGLEKEEEAHFIRYFTTFFSDIEYMREVKKYFDERIYTCLYEYFYNPAEDVDNLNFRFSTKKDTITSTPEGVKRPLEEPVVLDEMDDEEKLSYAVRKMYHVNELWEKLFDEENLDLNNFDPESYTELAQFEEFGDFEALLRLVPEMFIKAYKSVELAKIWWTQANRVYTLTPNPRNNTDSYLATVKTLEKNITELTKDVKKEEELLMVHEEDLRTLEQREARFNSLSSSCEAVEERKNDIGRQYNEFLSQRKSLTAELEIAPKGSSKEKSVTNALKRVGEQINTTSDELQLLTYNLNILQEDFQLELELRPTVIRYVENVRGKVLELEASIRDKLTNKRATEKRLALLRTNTEKMREIMRRHLESIDKHKSDKHADNHTATKASDDDLSVREKDDLHESVPDGDYEKHSGEGNRKQVRYSSDGEVHTYSADDESDAQVKSTYNDSGTRNDVSQRRHDEHQKRVNSHDDEPSQTNKKPHNRPKSPVRAQGRRIPILKQPNQDTGKQRTKAKNNVNRGNKTQNLKPKANIDSTTNSSPRIPRDEVTHKPERNDQPALIRLKPGAGQHSPDSGVGTDKSTPNGKERRKPRVDPYKNRRPSRVPMPALRPIPS